MSVLTDTTLASSLLHFWVFFFLLKVVPGQMVYAVARTQISTASQSLLMLHGVLAICSVQVETLCPILYHVLLHFHSLKRYLLFFYHDCHVETFILSLF